MSARHDTGIASVILLLAILAILAGIAGYLHYLGYQLLPFQKNPATFNSVSTQTQVDPKEIDGWQSYLIKYGQLRVHYPPNWLIKENPKETTAVRYIDFLYSKEQGIISDQYLLTITVGKSAEMPLDTTYLQKNFIIPALGNSENAYYLQNGGPATIRFDRNGVGYSISVNPEAALAEGIDPGESVNILTKMAKTLSFEEVAASCTEPVLKPLEDFPISFVLLNNHPAARSEKVQGYWPNLDVNRTQPPLPPVPSYAPDGTPLDSADTSSKIFVVSYQKDGNPFAESADFRKSVVEIEGGQNFYNPDASTAIVNVNCPELLQKGLSQDLYLIGRTGNDPLEIDIYGRSSNATALWGVGEWTVNLLKKTRDVVYVKRGEVWQKYIAQNYYVTR
jgi:hypothetical protein